MFLLGAPDAPTSDEMPPFATETTATLLANGSSPWLVTVMGVAIAGPLWYLGRLHEAMGTHAHDC